MRQVLIVLVPLLILAGSASAGYPDHAQTFPPVPSPGVSVTYPGDTGQPLRFAEFEENQERAIYRSTPTGQAAEIVEQWRAEEERKRAESWNMLRGMDLDPFRFPPSPHAPGPHAPVSPTSPAPSDP